MDKIMTLYKKYADYVLAGATAYWFVVGFLGDILFAIVDFVGLGILVRLLYMLVGLVGAMKLVEIFKPELIEKFTKK